MVQVTTEDPISPLWVLYLQVEKEPGLVKELERLSKSKNNNVKKEAQGALWKISGEVTHQQQAKQQTRNYIFSL